MKWRKLFDLVRTFSNQLLDSEDVKIMVNGKYYGTRRIGYSMGAGWFIEIAEDPSTSQYTLIETYSGVTDSITSFPTLEKARDAMNEIETFDENNDDVAIWHDGSICERKADCGTWIEEGDCGSYVLHNSDGEDILVQTDTDRPGLAMNLGWQPCHPETDGTVDCPVCGKTAGDLIEEATEFLDAHLGEKFDDPGYFDQEEEK